MKTLRLFISSPGDVGREREATRRVIERLQSEFAEHVTLDPYFWEWEPVDFGQDYQSQIPSTADFDIVICLLWSKLGSRLGDQYKLPPDGKETASSGTQYELMQALHQKQESKDKLPDLLVWVNKAPPPPASSPPLSRKDEDELIRQRRALQDFLATITRDTSTGIFTAAVNRYEVPSDDFSSYTYLDEFEDMMDKKLRKLIEKHIGQRTVKPKPQWQGSPYRDLDVFEFEHAPIFFGRSRAVGEVVRLLQNTLSKPQPCHFALILGASGSGKSSLARAGVLPLLTRPGVIEGIGLWRCAIVRPSDDSNDLFLALASALLRNVSDKPGGCPAALPELADPEANDPQQSLGAELRAHPQSVAIRVKDQLNAIAKAHRTQQSHALEAQIASLTKEGRQADATLKREALQQLQDPKARLVLLLDQMEELFTLNYAPEQLRAFLETIDVLARSGRVFVIATLRSDFYHRFQNPIPTDQKTLTTLVDLARDGARFDLLPPTPDEISQIIRSPARLAGLEFEPHPTIAEHTLADTLRDEALADPESLPLLEHVLNRLYEAQLSRADGRLTFTDHTTLGGVGGALGKHAEDIFTGQNLKPNETPPSWSEDTFRAVFGCLVTFGKGDGDADVPNRRAFAYDDLIKSEPAAQALVDTFIHERLLIADKDAQSRAIVRLSHEALLTRWPRLSQWLQTAPVRDLMSQRRRLESSLRQWQEQGGTPDCYLQPGFELEEGKQLLDRHEAALKPEEREFIWASVAYHAEREMKALNRRRRVVAVLATLTCVAIAAGLIAWSQAGLAKQAAQQSNTARLEALDAAENEKQANEKNLRTLHEASMADYAVAVQRIEKDNKWHEGIAHLARSLKWEPTNSLAAARLYSTLSLLAAEKENWPRQILRRKSFHCMLGSAQFSPDGSRIVTASMDWTAQVWDVASGEPLGVPLRHEDIVESAQFSPDGSRIVTVSWGKTARVWDTASGQPLGEPLIHEGSVISAQFSPDGSRILTTSDDRTARVWDAASGKLLGEPLQHEGKVVSAQFSPNGSYIVTVSLDSSARVWDSTRGELVGEPLRHKHAVHSAQFSPDGSSIVTASSDNTAQVWDVASGKPLSEPLRHVGWVKSAQFSSDGYRIVTVSNDNTVQVWNAASGKRLGEPLLHEGGVISAQFSPDGSRIVTSGWDNTALVWDAPRGEPQGVTLRHEDAVHSAQFSPDSSRIVTVSWDSTARVWDAAIGKPLSEPLRHDDWVKSAQFSSDGYRIVTVSNDNTVQVWNAASGKRLGEPLLHEGGVISAQFSPDGSRILTASDDRTARVWDAASGKLLGEPLRYKDRIMGAQFSPNGFRVVTVSDDNTGQVWDAASGKPIGEPLQHENKVYIAQFSPNGFRIVTVSVSLDYSARVWDATSGKLLGMSLDHESRIMSAQFSPDGSRIVTASEDKTARVWDATSGQSLGEPLRHEDTVLNAQFSPDSSLIVTASVDKTARVWDVASGKQVGEPLRHESPPESAQFSPDGSRIVTVMSSYHIARVWHFTEEMLHPPIPVPEWMLQRACAIAGLDFDAAGQMQTIPAEKRRAILLEPLPDNDAWALLARWAVLPANERSFTPASKFTRRQLAERERDSGYKEGIESALRYDPSVPLAHVLLAKFEENPQRADFLRGYGLKLLPDDAILWARAAKSLVEQKDIKRAQQAAQQALNLDPSNAEAKMALEAAKQAASGR